MTKAILNNIIFFFLLCMSSCTGNKVGVSIINQSGHNIKKLFLKCPGGDQTIEGLAKNSQTSMEFKTVGESSCLLIAILDNGDTISSTHNYVEGGYKLIETITQDSIITQYPNDY